MTKKPAIDNNQTNHK